MLLLFTAIFNVLIYSHSLSHTLIPSHPYIHPLTSPFTYLLISLPLGTKEDVECSRRGICDPTSGQCRCLPGFASSNGSSEHPGSRGDCTFYNKWKFS